MIYNNRFNSDNDEKEILMLLSTIVNKTENAITSDAIETYSISINTLCREFTALINELYDVKKTVTGTDTIEMHFTNGEKFLIRISKTD